MSVEELEIVFRPPYRECGRKCTYKWKTYATVSGVYVIRQDSTGEIMYVGMSSIRLYDMAYRHFQDWCRRKRKKDNDPRDTFYPRIGYSLALIPSEAFKELENWLIWKLQPTGNRNHQAKALVNRKVTLRYNRANLEAYRADYDLFEKYGYIA